MPVFLYNLIQMTTTYIRPLTYPIRITGILLLWFIFFSTEIYSQKKKETVVSIEKEQFLVNGSLTYSNRKWNNYRIEGLLMNARMVQGIFDDLNPETQNKWQYPDTHRWDPDQNTDEFVKSMKTWNDHGLLSFTINLQGGSPEGYSKNQPWHNSAFAESGSLRKDYLTRLEKILDRANELGMVPILGLFYFGQDERLKDEKAVIRGVDQIVDWILKKGYRNLLIEVNNECNVRYDHEILQPNRVHELIDRIKERSKGSLLVGTSYGGGFIPLTNVVKSSDFILIHGNGVSNPDDIVKMIQKTREVEGYVPKPILFNEDDHFDFDKNWNNFTAAISQYVSWGYFDYRMKDEGFHEGYQSIPVDWTINSERKKGFFKKLREITLGK